MGAFHASDRDKVASMNWFHAIDFGEFASLGRFDPGAPQNTTLFGVYEMLQAMDLSEAEVLDLGTADGIIAFGLAALGAKRVVAADTFDMPSFRLARRLLGYEDRVEYEPRLQISTLHRKFEPKTFDVIVNCGILYHMLHPQQAFSEVRKFIRDGGYVAMESPYDPDEPRAILHFNPVEMRAREETTYFIPSRSAMIGMAHLGGFQVLALRPLKGPPRLGMLLRAATREELLADPMVTDFTKAMLRRDLCDDEFRFKNLEALPPAPARVSMAPIPFEREIIAADETVTWPHHPPRDRDALGIARWAVTKSNPKGREPAAV